MGLIFAEKALYGSDAATTNPANSGRALGSAFRGIQTASCDFIFGTVRSSAVQDRSRNNRPPHTAQARGPRYEDPGVHQGLLRHSAAVERTAKGGQPNGRND